MFYKGLILRQIVVSEYYMGLSLRLWFLRCCLPWRKKLYYAARTRNRYESKDN